MLQIDPWILESRLVLAWTAAPLVVTLRQFLEVPQLHDHRALVFAAFETSGALLAQSALGNTRSHPRHKSADPSGSGQETCLCRQNRPADAKRLSDHLSLEKLRWP
jgi:hypothetical protein